MASGYGKLWEAVAIGGIVFSGRNVIGWGGCGCRRQSETCRIAENMGMVGVRDDEMMDMVEVGGNVAEMQY